MSTLKHRPGLEAHGVTVNILPFFLGGARDAAGNPWTPTPKWKEAFSKQDSTMTGELLGLKVVQPEEFPILSLFVSGAFCFRLVLRDAGWRGNMGGGGGDQP